MVTVRRCHSIILIALCDIHLVDFINDTPLVEGNTITAEFRTSKQADSIECIIPAAGIRIDCKL